MSMTSGGAGDKHKGLGRVAQMFKAASSASTSSCVRMGEMSKESSGPSQASSVLKVDVVCNISARSTESMEPAFKASAAGAVFFFIINSNLKNN